MLVADTRTYPSCKVLDYAALSIDMCRATGLVYHVTCGGTRANLGVRRWYEMSQISASQVADLKRLLFLLLFPGIVALVGVLVMKYVYCISSEDGYSQVESFGVCFTSVPLWYAAKEWWRLRDHFLLCIAAGCSVLIGILCIVSSFP